MAKTEKLLKSAFDRLLNHYGPRNWWPGDTPFEVMVGAILTQNTNWKNVEKAIENIKRKKLLDPKKLLDLQPSMLADLIRPAGFFRLKTKRLRNFLKYYIDNYDGSDERMAGQSLDTLRLELLAINGVGRETADSILLYALNKPIFVIDAYTKRILLRHSLCSEEAEYVELQELFTDSLSEDWRLYNEYHALIVEVAKEFCKKNPKCDECPLNGWNDS
ncbi:MAG: hypothetical protein HN337_08160 [Deltaproteobacteria bacterium]|jgi:endonuclease III related protein|nr:hypothetical protein [Deltaproteobacteria bacterium]